MKQSTLTAVANLERVKINDLPDILSEMDATENMVPLVVQKGSDDLVALVSVNFVYQFIELYSELTAPSVYRVCDLPDHIKQNIRESLPSEEEIQADKWSDDWPSHGDEPLKS
ncbi:hypothetical protein GCM10009096_07240 [Parasphingorhabdus litoris]|uniref:Uncharacterized protein n=1 Tax=Parasphingorhabdus litoris TaxID=394733 RepID=A0ABP3K0W5_9SPHN|nr:hypothetical protein [Parasphingorhabdus litoris]